MSKFWQKKYISKYTGAEIDAAVGNATKVEANPELAGTEAALTGIQVGDTKYKVESPEVLPEVDSGDLGYFLSVDEHGEWDLSPYPLILQVGDPDNSDHIKYGIEASTDDDTYHLATSPVFYNVVEPLSLSTKITTAINSIAAGLATDYKYHKASFDVDTSDANYEEIYNYYSQLKSNVPAVRKYSSTILGGGIATQAPYNGALATCLSSRGVMTGIGLGAFDLFIYDADATTVRFDLYAKREEVAT